MMLLGLIANAQGPFICEKISLWWVIGPDRSCGKNITKKQYSRKSCSATRPRLESTRYATFWKVKKEIPSGSRIFCKRKSVCNNVLVVSIKKSVYLK